MKYCYFNGKIVRKNEICLDLYDSGFLRGYAVFDVMRIYNSKPFLLADHFKRLLDSARIFNLLLPVSQKEFKNIIFKLIKKNNIKEAVVRTILTGGNIHGNGQKNFTFIVFFENFISLPNTAYKKGVRIIMLNFKRPIPEAKHTDYAMALASRQKMLKKRALELLYIFGEEIFECSTSNIFIVKNNILITPKNNILKGVTRKLVLNLAKKNKIRAKEMKISFNDLKNADEVFLTATNKEIVPIVIVDNVKIKDGKVGNMTIKLMSLFKKYTEDFYRNRDF